MRGPMGEALQPSASAAQKISWAMAKLELFCKRSNDFPSACKMLLPQATEL